MKEVGFKEYLDDLGGNIYLVLKWCVKHFSFTSLISFSWCDYHYPKQGFYQRSYWSLSRSSWWGTSIPSSQVKLQSLWYILFKRVKITWIFYAWNAMHTSVVSILWPLILGYDRCLICLKRIYNFWCSMLVYIPFALCFVTLCGVFMHFPELTY
jgi:hypothetical protein